MSDGHPSNGTAFSLRLIRWLCRQELAEEIQGNLLEFHERLYETDQSFKRLRYWLQVLHYLRPSTLSPFHFRLNPFDMFIFNPALTFRNILRHRSTALINLSGFTIGLICTFLLYFYISSELKVDRFHKNRDQIYRVLRTSSMQEDPYMIGVTSGPFAGGLQNDFPETILSTCRAYPEEGLVEVGNEVFYEEGLLFADSNFFSFFSFPLIKGDPATVLADPTNVVLSATLAKKYFGEVDPVGQMIMVNEDWPYTVTGIMGELPAKSHLEFDIVLNIDVFNQFDGFHNWWSNRLLTYVHLEHASDASYLETQFPVFMDKYFGDDFKRSGSRIGLTLEPLPDIYFNNQTRYDQALHGDFATLKILAMVGIAILCIACFNYTNLSIAQSFRRAKEVGVRKVLGGARYRLMLQFVGESITILMISLILAILSVELLRMPFNRYFDLDVGFQWANLEIWLFVAFMLSAIVIISGLYPAALLAGFDPVGVLKGTRSGMGRNLFVRKSMVISQFVISIFLIAATTLIFNQIRYLSEKDLGFERESILLLDLNHPEIRQKADALESHFDQHPAIRSYTSVSGEPGGFHDATILELPGFDNMRVRTAFVDEHYLETFRIDVASGEGFDPALTSQQETVMMVNEALLRQLGVDPDAVIGQTGRLPSWNNLERRVIGVARDFNFSSLKDDIEPLIIVQGGFHRRYALRIAPDQVKETLQYLATTWESLSPKFPMSYEFLEDSLAEHYENEEKQARVFTVFSGVSIFLACLGILGLAAYTAQQRKKEFGIRRVLGANARQIVTLIGAEFIKLLVVAAVVAIPLCWLFMEDWLNEFAYRISLAQNWSVFLRAGLLAMMVALVTIVLQTYKTAATNPAENIKYE